MMIYYLIHVIKTPLFLGALADNLCGGQLIEVTMVCDFNGVAYCISYWFKIFEEIHTVKIVQIEYYSG